MIYLKRVKKEEFEPLSEMAFTVAISNFPNEIKVLDRHNSKVDFILKNLKTSLKSQGFETLRQIIDAELAVQPRAKQEYSRMSDKEKKVFWNRVDRIDELYKSS